MNRVARSREALEPQNSLGDDLDVLGRDGHDLSPEHVEHIAVKSPCAPLEPFGIDEVGRTSLGDVHSQARVGRDECAGGAGVIEVDVGDEQVAKIGDREAELGKPGFERGESRTRSGIYERETVVEIKQIGAKKLLFTEETEVEKLAHAPRC
jgi:hypothetical protein